MQGVCRTPGTSGDTTPPAAPMLTSITPTSPSNNNSPKIVGSAEAASTVKLYTDAGCSAMIATGSAEELSSPGIAVTVTDDTMTAFYATATDTAGNVSACSMPLSYVEDSTAPPTPTLVDTLPLSPSRSLTPKVRGTVEAGVQVLAYATGDCSGTPLGMATADATGAFTIDISVAPASTTQIAAVARDAAGNTSACSGFGLTYIHNANALSAPTITSSTPTSPSGTSTTPTLAGMAEANVTVRIYTDALCSSAVAGMATSSGTGTFSIPVTVGANTTTSFYAQAFDSAVGQYSACSSSSLVYTHDALPPAAPSVTGSTPTSPSNSMMPTITGTAEASATVKLYTDAACTTAVVGGTGTATAGAFAIQVAASGTTTYYATATDAAGNVSSCSPSGYNFVYDATAPSAPSLTGTSPGSPSATNNTPIVIGTAENNSTVRVYRTSNCTGAEAGSGLATPGFGVSVTVPSNSITMLSATATDAAGNVSACSGMLTYVHDSIAPTPPTLTMTLPGSPANNNAPAVTGTTEAMARVQLYTDAMCTTPIGSLTTAGSNGAFSINVAVGDNSSTTFYGKATDGAGNVSGCSAGLGYTEDSVGPGQPTLNALPPSNSNTMPMLTGTAEASTTVYLYASTTCGGTAVAMGTVSGSGTYLIAVNVTANTSTPFTAKAVDAANNASPCSTAITYVHDNVVPAKPSTLASSPMSPNASTSPSITGNAEAGSTVRIYTNSTCSTAVTGTATAGTGGTFSIPVTVGAGSTTTFYATATDSANNTSPCSTDFVTYIQDSGPPNPPTALATVPGSPANNTMPSVTGNAEAGSTVKIYKAAGCTAPSFAAMGTTSGLGSFSIPVSVTANTSTTFYATATDGAGNTSTCTASGVTYVHDSNPPATPSALSTTPPSPANYNTPKIHGTTEALASVAAYKDAACSMLAGTATAAADGQFDVTVTVMDNTTTTFYVRATDAANNSSPCTATASITYVEDSTAVSPPILTATNPMSPSNSSTTPTITGTTGASFTVRLYTDAQCIGAQAGMGTANAAGAFSIMVSVTANTTTTFYGTANNGVNTSACSSGLVYIHDNQNPTAPSGLTMVPTGPANNNTPVVRGSAEAGTTVTIYANATCSGGAAGSGTSNGTFNIMVNAGVVGDNTTTTFSAKATDAANNSSGCSTSVSYIEDSAGPGTPTITSTSPGSPANANNPTVIGTAEAGSTVSLYTMAGCAGAAIATTTAVAPNNFSVPISVGDNSTTPLYARAVDAANNPSGCSAAFNYVEDSAAPGIPALTTINPAGPANQNSPVVTGTTSESGATIQLFDNATCTGAPIGTGVSGAGGAFSVTASVLDDSTTTIYANARDVALNTSSCSTTSLSYVEDSAPPDPPKALTVDPKSPANDNQPTIYGFAEAGTTVHLYTDAGCSSASVGSGTVDANGEFMIQVTAGVIADDSTQTFYASATDAAGNMSSCSGEFVEYIEDSTALPPTLTGSTPSSPHPTSTTPTINGNAEPGSGVQLFTNSACTGAVVGSGSTAGLGTFSISVTAVAANSSTTYWGMITDQAGNMSACSTTSVTFISDQKAPTFAGATGAAATSFDRILLQWTAATDTFTSSANMRYDICWGATPHACDTWTTRLTVTGITSRLITGLNASTRYWFQVRAVDQAGNVGIPSPQIEVTDRTFGTGSTAVVTTGYNFACALAGDGTVQCWGAGTSGQLGNGASADSLVPVTVTGLVDAVGVAAGGAQAIGTSHACAVKSDGTVWCWGYGGNGNLGNGNTGTYNVPVQVLVAASTPLTNAVAVTAGGGHSCALISDGTIRCWGRGGEGQLGDNTGTQRNYATLVSTISSATSLDAGAYHTCAVLGDGTARCWGSGTFGQLGNGMTSGQLAPVTVSFTGAERAKAIDVGDWHSCALMGGGTVRCWGANTTGQLGNNTTTSSSTPVTVLTGGVVLTNVSSISAGGAYVGGVQQGTSCATLANGSARCWGYNGFGQIGDNTTTNRLTAVAVSGSAIAARLSVGADFTCGLSGSGSLACWGDGGNGRLGTGTTANQFVPTAVQNLYGVEGATAVSGWNYHECARFSNGRARCWGNNGYGQLGINSTVNTPYPELPVMAGGTPLGNLTSVATSYLHACAVRADGTVWCWGNNSYGNLGDGTSGTSSYQAVNVAGVTNAIAVTTGFYHSCALIADGTMRCWGYNGNGALGDNTTTSSSTAVTVSGLSGAVAIAALGYSTCAVIVDGTARCWGHNQYGQIGDMTTVQKLVPTVVTGIANAVSITGGAYHACAVAASGTAKCWGLGDSGQLGNGMVGTTNSIPVNVTGSAFRRIAAGWYTTCSTKSDGRAFCWGNNGNRQVGDGTTTNPITTPSMVSGVATVYQVTAGYHSSALHSDGTADAWGQGDTGGCGDGDLGAHNVPTATSVLYMP